MKNHSFRLYKIIKLLEFKLRCNVCLKIVQKIQIIQGEEVEITVFQKWDQVALIENLQGP